MAYHARNSTTKFLLSTKGNLNVDHSSFAATTAAVSSTMEAATDPAALVSEGWIYMLLPIVVFLFPVLLARVLPKSLPNNGWFQVGGLSVSSWLNTYSVYSA